MISDEGDIIESTSYFDSCSSALLITASTVRVNDCLPIGRNASSIINELFTEIGRSIYAGYPYENTKKSVNKYIYEKDRFHSYSACPYAHPVHVRNLSPIVCSKKA